MTPKSRPEPQRGGILVLALSVALAGCSRAPTITVANRATVTLSNVVVSGAGFSNRIERIAAGVDHTFTIHPSGESGLRLAFDAGGQHIDFRDQGYVEAGGGYRVRATVSSNLSVSITSDLHSY